MQARSIYRVAGLAVGLGIGAAGAATSWTAYADDGSPPSDPSIAADITFLAPNPAAASDMAVSVDGFTLFQQGTATATSGTGDIAIAFGAGSDANATGGFGDIAFANGTDSAATAIYGNGDLASALGDHTAAVAGGTSLTVLGNNDIAEVFDPFGTVGSTATAGAVEDFPGNFDLGAVFGDMLNSFHAVGGNFLVDVLP